VGLEFFDPLTYDWTPGLPLPEYRTVHSKTDFKVGSFTIESIDFIRDGGDIELYSGFLKDYVKNPEWTINGRDVPPSSSHFNHSTSAPAVYKFGETLKMKVGYDCHGMNNVQLYALCRSLDYSPEFDHIYCPFGDIDPYSIPCNQNYVEVESNSSSDQVAATYNMFDWEIDSEEMLFENPIVEQSEHRIYSVIDEPKRPGLWDSDEAWIELLEISTQTLDGSTNCEYNRELLTKAIWGNTWQSYNNYLFIDPAGWKMQYAADIAHYTGLSFTDGEYFIRIDLDGWPYTAPIHWNFQFELFHLLSDLEVDHQYQFVDCKDNSMFLSVNQSSVGCFANHFEIYGHKHYYHEPQYRNSHAQAPNILKQANFYYHMFHSYDNKLWDPSLKIPPPNIQDSRCSDGSTDESICCFNRSEFNPERCKELPYCMDSEEANCYSYAIGIDKWSYYDRLLNFNEPQPHFYLYSAITRLKK
jgi:hypothetical protein